MFMSAPLITTIAQPSYDYSKLQHEKLNRGVVAIRNNALEVTILWRYLSSDPIETSFNVYKDGKKITDTLITISTMFCNQNDSQKATVYEVRPVTKGKETHHINRKYTLPENAPSAIWKFPCKNRRME